MRGPGEPAVVVRRARPEDARAVAAADFEGEQALLAEAYPEGYPDHWFSRPPLEPIEAYWTTALLADRSPAWATFVVEVGATVIGYACASPMDGDPTRGYIHAMYVHPLAWRRGAGRALADAAVEHLRALGCTAVELWAVEGSVRSRAFYGALGWSLTGSFARQGPDPGLPIVQYLRPL